MKDDMLDALRYGTVTVGELKGFSEEDWLAAINSELSTMAQRICVSMMAETSQEYGHYDIVQDVNGEWRLFEKGTNIPAKDACTHEWKEYVGFTQRYKYCVRCDSKRGQE